MTTPLVLELIDLNKLFVIKNDASNIGIRANLMQECHPLAFINKPFSPRRQQALFVYEREMLAILHAVTKWRHYL